MNDKYLLLIIIASLKFFFDAVEADYDPHYCQYGWTAVSVWLDLFSHRQLTVMWIQLETTYTKQSAPAAGIQDSNVVMPPAAHSCAKRRDLKQGCGSDAFE